MSEDNKWSRPASPPPKMFFNDKERDLVSQINNEISERILGQVIAYYPINVENTNYHSVYGEALVKTFDPPIRIFALIDWEGSETETTNYGIDRRSSVTVHFHKRRLTEDQDVWVQEGDMICYGDQFYEIVELSEPREIFGYAEHHMEISAKCIKARDGTFNAE